MVSTYYKIEHAFPDTGRWYLNGLKDHTGNKLDVRIFTYGHLIGTTPTLRLSSPADGEFVDVVPPLHISLRRPGPPLDFTLGDFDVPVVTKRVAQLLTRVADEDIQKFPVRIDSSSEEYNIINCTRIIDCIDLQDSNVTYWSAEDGLPDMIGKLQMVIDLVIDPHLAQGRQLFRLEGWPVALIASSDVKKALEDEGVTGICFKQVSK